MSQSSKGSLVGSIIERKSVASPILPPALRPNAINGFPTVQHRSKSAFQRAREDQKKSTGSERLSKPPVIASPRAVEKSPAREDDEDEHPGSRVIAAATEDWRRQMEEENKRRVEAMTEEEREAEKKEILERFGPNIVDILRKAREARERPQGQSSAGAERRSRPRSDSKVLKSEYAR